VIAILDYGMGNLRSIQKAFEHIGAEAQVTSDQDRISKAGAVVLPGVGAFGDAMANLRRLSLIEPLHRVVAEGKPILGICLGLELLFTHSEERGYHEGLKLLEGEVRRFRISARVPHVGWNQIHIQRESRLLSCVEDGSFAYFVHSYYAEPEDASIVLATTDYEMEFASVVGKDNIYGIQFHPEKSQEVGLRILENFARL